MPTLHIGSQGSEKLIPKVKGFTFIVIEMLQRKSSKNLKLTKFVVVSIFSYLVFECATLSIFYSTMVFLMKGLQYFWSIYIYVQYIFNLINKGKN